MRTKTKKIFFRIGIALVILITAGLFIRAFFNYTTGKQLERQVEKMKSEGKRMTLKEFEPECRDEGNAARYWNAAAAMIVLEPSDKEMLNKTEEDIFYHRRLEEKAKEQLTKIIAKNQKALQLILEAADKPCYKSSKSWNGPDYEIETEKAVKLIFAVRLLAIDSVLKAEGDKLDEAVNQCCAGMRFFRKTLQEPFLINYLISVASMKRLISCLNRITAGKKLETDMLLNILKEFETDSWRKGLVWSFETERALNFETGIRLLSGKMQNWLFKLALKSKMTWSLKLWEDMERAAQLPYYETEEMRNVWEEKYSHSPWYFRIAGFLFPNLATVMFKEATLEASLLSAQIGLGCKIYKNREGRYPEKISDLVPDIIKKEPLDPFTGKQFIYRLQEAGFIVYSVGSNKKDDNGRGTLAITSIVMEKDDDWAWKEEIN